MQPIISRTYWGYTFTKNFCLKFKFNWVSLILSDNPAAKPEVFPVRPLMKIPANLFYRARFLKAKSDFMAGKVLVYTRSGKACQEIPFSTLWLLRAFNTVMHVVNIKEERYRMKCFPNRICPTSLISSLFCSWPGRTTVSRAHFQYLDIRPVHPNP